MLEDRPDGRCSDMNAESREFALEDAGLLVNATSLGMAGEPELPIDLSRLPREAVVVDIVYVPLETPLLAAARQRGNRGVDGLGMLLHQGRPGFEAWFGAPVRVSREMRAAVITSAFGSQLQSARIQWRTSWLSSAFGRLSCSPDSATTIGPIAEGAPDGPTPMKRSASYVDSYHRYACA